MRELFKRGAKVSLAIRKLDISRDLRGMLADRIRPMLDYLSAELAELALHRFETDLERMGDAFEVAVSAFASEVANDDSDRRDHDPVPNVQGGAGRLLHGDAERSGIADSGFLYGPDPRPAQAPHPRREEGQRPTRLVDRRGPGLIERHLGPEIAALLDPQPKRVQSNGKQMPSCSKCGYVGGNARGCGTAHATQFMGARSSPDRRAAIAELAKGKPTRPVAQPDSDDGQWSAERIAAETVLAEESKPAGSLPTPRSSFTLARSCHDDISNVDELEVEASG